MVELRRARRVRPPFSVSDTFGDGGERLTSEEATRAGILGRLDELKGCSEDDFAVIAFSGHGSELHQLVTHDADVTNLAGTTIPLSELARPARQGKTHRTWRSRSGSVPVSPAQRVAFATATEWVARLGDAQRQGRLDEEAPQAVTSSKQFSGWGEIFGDETVAAAMIDRLVHHTEILSLKGDSDKWVTGDNAPVREDTRRVPTYLGSPSGRNGPAS